MLQSVKEVNAKVGESISAPSREMAEVVTNMKDYTAGLQVDRSYNLASMIHPIPDKQLQVMIESQKTQEELKDSMNHIADTIPQALAEIQKSSKSATRISILISIGTFVVTIAVSILIAKGLI